MRYLEASVLLEDEGRQHVLSDFSHELRDLRLQVFNTLVPLNRVFSIGDTVPKAAWNPLAGGIQLDSAAFSQSNTAPEQIIAEWLVTPDREARDNLSTLLAVWGSAKDTSQSLSVRPGDPIREVFLRCSDAARRIVAAAMLFRDAIPPASPQRALFYEQRRVHFLKQCPELHWIVNQDTEVWRWLWNPVTTPQQNAFFRALLAGLRNTFQHSMGTPEVRCSVWCSKELIFHVRLLNACTTARETKGGTTSVLERALGPIAGGVSAFEFLPEQQQFLTEFYFRLDSIFTKEKSHDHPMGNS
jgi:hypothetical protein